MTPDDVRALLKRWAPEPHVPLHDPAECRTCCIAVLGRAALTEHFLFLAAAANAAELDRLTDALIDNQENGYRAMQRLADRVKELEPLVEKYRAFKTRAVETIDLARDRLNSLRWDLTDIEWRSSWGGGTTALVKTTTSYLQRADQD